MRAMFLRGWLRRFSSVRATLLLACSLLFVGPRAASAVVIANPNPTIEHLDVTDFLDLSYSLLLGRAPDPSGADTFGAFLSAGGDTTVVATEIDTSAEYYARAVTAYFQQFLKRSPDGTELSTWVAQMEGGLTDEAVIAALVGSAEYRVVWNITTPAQLIAQLFQNLLGRSPAASESAYWQTVLASSGAAAVAEDIESSSEYLSRLIAELYETDLDRLPSSNETNTFLDLFSAGDTNEQVIALLVGSAEFLGDAETLGGSNDSLRLLEFERRASGVPEPPALWLLALGILCVAGFRRVSAQQPDSASRGIRSPVRGYLRRE